MRLFDETGFLDRSSRALSTFFFSISPGRHREMTTETDDDRRSRLVTFSSAGFR